MYGKEFLRILFSELLWVLLVKKTSVAKTKGTRMTFSATPSNRTKHWPAPKSPKRDQWNTKGEVSLSENRTLLSPTTTTNLFSSHTSMRVTMCWDTHQISALHTGPKRNGGPEFIAWWWVRATARYSWWYIIASTGIYMQKPKNHYDSSHGLCSSCRYMIILSIAAGLLSTF